MYTYILQHIHSCVVWTIDTKGFVGGEAFDFESASRVHPTSHIRVSMYMCLVLMFDKVTTTEKK